MRRPVIHTYVGWEKYIIPYEHKGISKAMESQGVNFYAKVADIINTSWKKQLPQSVIAKIFNKDIAIIVPRKDYEVVLKHCLKWFEIQELYEYCAIVRDYLEERNNSPIQKLMKEILI